MSWKLYIKLGYRGIVHPPSDMEVPNEPSLAIVATGDCLPWTDRLGTRFPGRCPGSNQVRSVPSSSDARWTVPLYPKKKKEKHGGP